MGFNTNDIISDDAREKERQDRLDRNNPPSTAHGQDEGFDSIDIDSLFGNSNSSGSSGSDQFGDFGSLGGSQQSGFGGFGGFDSQQPQQQPKKEAEDVFFDALKVGGGGLIGFFKDFVHSTKGLDAIYWSNYGAVLFKVSGILALLLFVLVLLGLDTLGYMIGSGVASAIGVITLSFSNDKARELKALNEAEGDQSFFDINSIETEQPTLDELPSMPEGLLDDEEENNDIFDWDEDEDEEEVEFEDLYEDDSSMFETVEEAETNVEEVLKQVDTVPSGMYTRQFLYENYMNVLTKMTPEFNNVIALTEDDEEWDTYSVLVREAQEQMGLDNSNEDYESDLSEVVSVEKRLLTIKIEATRPKKLTGSKLADFDKELTNLVSVENGEMVQGRYTKSLVAGSTLYTTIFLGETATVSVKDALAQEKDFILDGENKLPVVMGFDHIGNTIKADLFDVESIITAGMPRGGKSFSVKTVMSQVIQFASPKDVVFYFADVKGQLSDWYEFKMPHIKSFESKPEKILAMLTHITDVEANRRAKIFREAGALNYKMYKKKNPDADMPVIYVVIDEMTTLSQEFSTEDAKAYRSKLVNIVTKMPSFGVRLWGIPHVIKNDILPKTVSDTIGCRISVRGDESHIETTTGAKPKNFPYKLTNAGDCAVKMPLLATEVFFMHSFILAKGDEGVSRILEYQTNLWNRLEPELAKNSFASKLSNQNSHNDLLTKVGLNTDVQFDDEGMF